MRRLRDHRGSATVELAFVLPVLLLLAMGAMMVVQIIFESHRLSAAVTDVTRYASRADYDTQSDVDTPACAKRTRRSADQVKEFAVDSNAVASTDDVGVVGEAEGSEADLCTLLPGDRVTVTLHRSVGQSNPLYQVTATLTNALGAIFGGTPFDPAGFPIKSEATTYVE